VIRSLRGRTEFTAVFFTVSWCCAMPVCVLPASTTAAVALRTQWLSVGTDVRPALDEIRVSTLAPWFDRSLAALTGFQISVRLRQADRAAEYWNDFSDHYPMRQIGLLELAKQHAQGGDTAVAEQLLSRAISDDSRFIEARRIRASLREKLHNYRAAAADYEMIAMHIPSDPTAIRDAQTMRLRAAVSQEAASPIEKPFAPSAITAAPLPLAVSSSPEMAIGISTQDNGNLLRVRSYRFSVACDFSVTGRDGKPIRSYPGGTGRIYEVTFTPAKGHISLADRAAGRTHLLPTQGFRIVPSTFSTFSIDSLTTPRSTLRLNRIYRGVLEVFPYRGERLILVNRIPMDAYLLSVLPAEIGADKPVEALKAQAVAARTYAWYARGSCFHKTFHLCSGQHCQVYRGVAGENDAVRHAVAATAGEVLIYEGRPVAAFYHANCGGMTHNGTETGWSRAPYLRGTIDGPLADVSFNDHAALYRWYLSTGSYYSAASQYIRQGQFRWVRVVTRREMSRHLNRFMRIGELKSVSVLKRSATGLVQAVKLTGVYKKTPVSFTVTREHLIRAYLAPGGIKSASFLLEYDVVADTYYLWGAGWGHGMGMCQSGACGLAERGKNYVDILTHYYPGAVTSRQYGTPPSECVSDIPAVRAPGDSVESEDGEWLMLDFGDEIHRVVEQADETP